MKNAVLAKIFDFIESLLNRGDFQESNNFLKLCLSAFKTKKEPKVAGLIPTFSWDFLKTEIEEEVVNFLFKINQN